MAIHGCSLSFDLTFELLISRFPGPHRFASSRRTAEFKSLVLPAICIVSKCDATPNAPQKANQEPPCLKNHDLVFFIYPKLPMRREGDRSHKRDACHITKESSLWWRDENKPRSSTDLLHAAPFGYAWVRLRGLQAAGLGRLSSEIPLRPLVWMRRMIAAHVACQSEEAHARGLP